MSSLVPGYMTVSWTVSSPAVGVRATCGVEGRPEGGIGMVYLPLPSLWSWCGQTFLPRQIDTVTWLNVHTNSPRRGLTVVLTHTVPKMLDRVELREYFVPACSPMM